MTRTCGSPKGDIHYGGWRSVEKELSIWQEDNAFEMMMDTVSGLESLYFRHSNILNTGLGGEEIIVRVGAVGLNFWDLLLVLGSLSWHAPGLEGAGVVVDVGSRAKEFRAGDYVFYIVNKAGMVTFVRIPSLRVHRLPESLNIVDAASMSVAYSTAITSILESGRLRRGEKVLIHSASGVGGQTCIIIPQQVGARIFATAVSTDKREFVPQTFGIPTTQIFSSWTPQLEDEILQAMVKRGVDAIFNFLSGWPTATKL